MIPTEYLNVKTGQDLIDKGIIPKSSPAHFAVVTSKRLDALLENVTERLEGRELGRWIPAVKSEDINGKTSKKKYSLVEGAFAHTDLGHKVRAAKRYEFHVADASGNETTLVMDEGRLGKLVKYDERMGEVTILVDKEGKKSQKPYVFQLADLEGILEVSSLGCEPPKEGEDAIREATLSEFFPKTVVSTNDSERVIIGMLLGKPMVFYGPPGSGKSSISKDTLSIGMQQEVIFVAEGCDMQCNPASLYDESFAEKCQPCPKCKIKRCPDYKNTGIFVPLSPKDVPVKVCKYSEGFGIETFDATSSSKRMHLAGFKLPSFDPDIAAQRENEYNPDGFHPGVLPRTNNGILFIEEIDKLREQSQTDLLRAFEDKELKPDEIRFDVPAYQLVLATANDVTKLSAPLNDRMFFLKIPYPRDVEVSYEITRRAFHGEFVPIKDTPIENTHKTAPLNIKGVPMPVIIERAVDALYIKFRAEYKEQGVNEIMGSPRSKLDALTIARAKLFLDQKFYRDAPRVAGLEQAVFGVQYAFCTRVSENNFERDHDVKVEVSNWVADNFQKVLKDEESAWWCDAFKYIETLRTQAPIIEEKFINEWTTYHEIVDDKNKDGLCKGDFTPIYHAYNEVKKAKMAGPNDLKARAALVAFPFMDYLFDNQPKMDRLDEPQIKELMTYMIDSSKDAKCKPPFIS